MIFRSKVDVWFLLVLLAGSIAMIAGTAHVILSGQGWFVPGLMALSGIALPVWILLSTKYIVLPGHVRVESGPFRWHIQASGITRIAPTRACWSGPALSLDRLCIEYENGKKSLLVSPSSPDEFIRAVENAKSAARHSGQTEV